MDAYIIGVSHCSGRDRHRNGVLRMVDLSPSAKVRVMNANYGLVYSKIESGELELPGIDTSQNKKIIYRGVPVDEVFPDFDTTNPDDLVALKIGTIQDEPTLVCARLNGSIGTLTFENIVFDKELRRSIHNLKLLDPKNSKGRPVSLIVRNMKYSICDGTGYHLTFDNRWDKHSITVDLPYTDHETKNLDLSTILNKDRWPTVKEWMNTMALNNRKYLVKENYEDGEFRYFFGVTEDTLDIIIPNGITQIHSFICGPNGEEARNSGDNGVGEQLYNANIRTIWIPNTVRKIYNSAFSEINPNTKFIFQDFDEQNPKRMDVEYSGFSSCNLNMSQDDILNMIPHNLSKLNILKMIVDNKETSRLDLRSKNFLEAANCGGSFSRRFDGDSKQLFIDFPDTVKHISSCCQFDRYMSDRLYELEDEVLRLPEDIEVVRYSYTGLKVKKIDLSNCKKLRLIYCSFSSLEGVEEIDLSGCDALTEIDSSFNDIPSLKTLKLPPSLSKITSNSFLRADNLDLSTVDFSPNLLCIGSASFSNSTGEVELKNPSMYSMLGFSADSVIKWNVRVLTAANMGYNSGSQTSPNRPNLIVPELEEFGNSAFDNTRFGGFSKITFDKSKILRLGKKAFFATTYERDSEIGDRLDFSEFSLKSIGELCFAKSRWQELILPVGLTYIGDNAFSEASINKLLIPSTVTDWGSRIAFRLNIGSALFVVENSPIHKYFKKTPINLVVSKSDEESLAKFRGEFNKASAREVIKAQFVGDISGDPTLQSLTSDENVAHINKTLPIYNKFKDGALLEKLSIKTNYIPIEKFYDFGDAEGVIDLFRDNGSFYGFHNIMDLDGYESRDLHGDSSVEHIKKVFGNFTEQADIDRATRILCDLVMLGTTRLDPTSAIDDINKILDKDRHNRAQFLRIYAEGSRVIIGSFDLVITMTESAKTICIYFIIDKSNNKLIHMGACVTQSVSSFLTISESKTLGYRTYSREYETWLGVQNFGKVSADEVLEIGGTYSYSSYRPSLIDGFEIPRVLRNRLSEVLKQLILIGKNTSRRDGYQYLYVNVFTGKLYKINFATAASSTNPLSSLMEQIEIQDMVDIHEFELDKLKSNLKFLLGEPIKLNEFKAYAGDKKDVIEQLVKNNKNAYDDLNSCYEWQLSKWMQQAGVKSIKEISLSNIGLILKSAYFVSAKKPLDKIESIYGGRKSKIELADGTVLTERIRYSVKLASAGIVGFHGKYCYTINEAVDKGKTVEHFVSNESIQNCISDIYSIYSDTTNPSGYIEVCKKYSIDDFRMLCESRCSSTIADYSSYSKQLLIGIAVNKRTGYVYLAAWVPSFYQIMPLLRYKDVQTAIKANMALDRLSERKNPNIHTNHILSYATCAFSTRNPDDLSGQFASVVRAVVAGYPNGYEEGDTFNSFFSSCAKQPPNKTKL